MFKLISVIFIISATILFVFEYSKVHTKSYKFTYGCIKGFEYILSLVTYEQLFLADAMDKAADISGEAKNFFKVCSSNIKRNVTAEKAFEDAISFEEYCPDECFEILYDYFINAGMMNVEIETGKLRSLIERLSVSEKKQKEYMCVAVKQNKKLIIAIAAAICICII